MTRGLNVFGLSLFLLAVSLKGSFSAGDEHEENRGGDGGGSIESIMKRVHGKRGLVKTLENQLAAKSVDWAAVQAATKKILPLAEALGKKTPERGTEQSWAELTAIYAENAQELARAAGKKDLENTKAYLGEMNASCNKCHMRHRERD